MNHIPHAETGPRKPEQGAATGPLKPEQVKEALQTGEKGVHELITRQQEKKIQIEHAQQLRKMMRESQDFNDAEKKQVINATRTAMEGLGDEMQRNMTVDHERELKPLYTPEGVVMEGREVVRDVQKAVKEKDWWTLGKYAAIATGVGLAVGYVAKKVWNWTTDKASSFWGWLTAIGAGTLAVGASLIGASRMRGTGVGKALQGAEQGAKEGWQASAEPTVKKLKETITDGATAKVLQNSNNYPDQASFMYALFEALATDGYQVVWEVGGVHLINSGKYLFFDEIDFFKDGYNFAEKQDWESFTKFGHTYLHGGVVYATSFAGLDVLCGLMAGKSLKGALGSALLRSAGWPYSVVEKGGKVTLGIVRFGYNAPHQILKAKSFASGPRYLKNRISNRFTPSSASHLDTLIKEREVWKEMISDAKYYADSELQTVMKARIEGVQQNMQSTLFNLQKKLKAGEELPISAGGVEGKEKALKSIVARAKKPSQIEIETIEEWLKDAGYVDMEKAAKLNVAEEAIENTAKVAKGADAATEGSKVAKGVKAAKQPPVAKFAPEGATPVNGKAAAKGAEEAAEATAKVLTREAAVAKILQTAPGRVGEAKAMSLLLEAEAQGLKVTPETISAIARSKDACKLFRGAAETGNVAEVVRVIKMAEQARTVTSTWKVIGKAGAYGIDAFAVVMAVMDFKMNQDRIAATDNVELKELYKAANGVYVVEGGLGAAALVLGTAAAPLAIAGAGAGIIYRNVEAQAEAWGKEARDWAKLSEGELLNELANRAPTGNYSWAAFADHRVKDSFGDAIEKAEKAQATVRQNICIAYLIRTARLQPLPNESENSYKGRKQKYVGDALAFVSGATQNSYAPQSLDVFQKAFAYADVLADARKGSKELTLSNGSTIDLSDTKNFESQEKREMLANAQLGKQRTLEAMAIALEGDRSDEKTKQRLTQSLLLGQVMTEVNQLAAKCAAENYGEWIAISNRQAISRNFARQEARQEIRNALQKEATAIVRKKPEDLTIQDYESAIPRLKNAIASLNPAEMAQRVRDANSRPKDSQDNADTLSAEKILAHLNT